MFWSVHSTSVKTCFVARNPHFSLVLTFAFNLFAIINVTIEIVLNSYARKRFSSKNHSLCSSIGRVFFVGNRYLNVCVNNLWKIFNSKPNEIYLFACQLYFRWVKMKIPLFRMKLAATAINFEEKSIKWVKKKKQNASSMAHTHTYKKRHWKHLIYHAVRQREKNRICTA